MIEIQEKLKTKEKMTWCPRCPNYMIHDSVRKTLAKFISKGKYKQTDFCMVCDIGCNGKIFDYLDISGIYGLHGRSLATALGVKLGNPKLKVLTFSGDGGVYSEGMEHFIHSFRYNPEMVLLVHDNQAFSLTTGQATPTTQLNYKSKSIPSGEKLLPLNPIKLAMAAGATFIARVNAKDIEHTCEILEKAIEHKGFAFIEILQDCIIFNIEMEVRDKMSYKIKDNFDKDKANKFAEEWNYSDKTGKIPCGILYWKK